MRKVIVARRDERTLLVDGPSCAGHGHDTTATSGLARVGGRELRPAVGVEDEVPHERRAGVVVDGSDVEVVHVPLYCASASKVWTHP